MIWPYRLAAFGFGPVVAPVAEAAAGPEVIKEKKEEGEAAAPATGAAKAAAPAAKEKEAKK